MSGRLRTALAIALWMPGCGSVLPKPPRSDFFVLTALESAAATAAAPQPSILLGAVVLPEYLDRPELVTRLDSNQLRVEELELWAEPLRDSFTRTVERDLGALLGRGRVQQLPWTAPAPPELLVSVEVRRFEKTAAGRVELAARWAIIDGRAGTERRRQETRLSYPAPATTTQAAVATMSQALAALSREIAQGVRDLERQASRP